MIMTIMTSNSGTIIAAAAGITTLITIIVFRSYKMRQNFLRITNPDLKLKIEEAIGSIVRGKPSRTVLVVGGNGFLGRYIVKMLSEDPNVKVIVLDITLPAAAIRIDTVTYIQGNILNMEHIAAVFAREQIHSVIHTASLIPIADTSKEAMQSVNVGGTKNLLAAASNYGVESFIYTSSATVVLDGKDKSPVVKITESEATYPKHHIDEYTSTKSVAEKLVLAANGPKLATCVLRPPNIFGDGDKQLADACKNPAEPPLFLGEGSSLMDWVPVECVAHAHVLAERALADAENAIGKRATVSGNAYFVGNNEQIPYNWFMGLTSISSSSSSSSSSSGSGTKAVSHWGKEPAKSLPLWIVYPLAYINVLIFQVFGVVPLNKALVPILLSYTQRSYTFCSDKAFRDFGYKPILSVREAIAAIVHRYQQQQQQLLLLQKQAGKKAN